LLLNFDFDFESILLGGLLNSSNRLPIKRIQNQKSSIIVMMLNPMQSPRRPPTFERKSNQVIDGLLPYRSTAEGSKNKVTIAISLS